MGQSKSTPGQRPAPSLGNTDEETEQLYSKLFTLAWRVDVAKDAEAKGEMENLCRRHRFLARERAQMVKQTQEAQVALARRKRRGEPLVPIKVIKANGRVRQLGPRLPSGRAPRRACNLHVRGSDRSRSGSRSPPSGDDDPGGEDDDGGDDHHLVPVLLGRTG